MLGFVNPSKGFRVNFNILVLSKASLWLFSESHSCLELKNKFLLASIFLGQWIYTEIAAKNCYCFPMLADIL